MVKILVYGSRQKKLFYDDDDSLLIQSFGHQIWMVCWCFSNGHLGAWLYTWNAVMLDEQYRYTSNDVHDLYDIIHSYIRIYTDY